MKVIPNRELTAFKDVIKDTNNRHEEFNVKFLFQLNYILDHENTFNCLIGTSKKNPSLAVLGQNATSSQPIKFAAQALGIGQYQDSDNIAARRKYR